MAKGRYGKIFKLSYEKFTQTRDYKGLNIKNPCIIPISSLCMEIFIFYVSGKCGKWPDAFFLRKKGFE